MRSDKDDRNFPAIRLADAPNNDSPTELHRHKLKELAGRMDQLHSFTKGQGAIRQVEAGSQKPQISRLRGASDRDRYLAQPYIRSG